MLDYDIRIIVQPKPKSRKRANFKTMLQVEG